MSKPIWPMIALGELAKPVQRPVSVEPGRSYRTLGVKWWGEGAYERQTIDGSQTAAKTLNEVREDDLIINKIWVRHGSVAVVSPEVASCCGSNEFPVFEFRRDRIEPRWMHWYSKTTELWTKCDSLSQGTSGKNRIRPEKFLTVTIPLPPIDEQKRIIARIDRVAGMISEANLVTSECANQSNVLLKSIFNRIVKSAPMRQLGEVAPLRRRPAVVELGESYQQVSVRSFGRGTFHNPPLHGSEITWQKPHLVKAGDILVSNIKAWEGAIAVAGQADDGRYGSHRYLTFVPVDKIATANFLCFYLLSPEGLFQVGEASPGSADRNRTLSTKKMQSIPVPVPSYQDQLEFDAQIEKFRLTSDFRTQASAERDALLPSILDRAFKGEL